MSDIKFRAIYSELGRPAGGAFALLDDGTLVFLKVIDQPAGVAKPASFAIHQVLITDERPAPPAKVEQRVLDTIGSITTGR